MSVKLRKETKQPEPSNCRESMLKHKKHFEEFNYDHDVINTPTALGFSPEIFEGVSEIDFENLDLPTTGLLLIHAALSEIAGPGLALGALGGDFTKVVGIDKVSKVVEIIAKGSDEIFIAALHIGALEKTQRNSMAGMLAEMLDAYDK